MKRFALALGEENTNGAMSLSPHRYKHTTLIASQGLCENIVKLTFKLNPTESLHSLGFDLGLGDFIRIKVNGVSRGRAFSPTSSPEILGSFTITVKIYEKGEITPYLEKMFANDKVLICGPCPVPWLTRKLSQSHKHTLIVALGIGVTEAIFMCESELLNRKIVTLLISVQKFDDLIFSTEIANLRSKFPETFVVHTTLTREKKEHFHNSRPSVELFRLVFASALQDPTSSAVLVVGTKKMSRELYSMFLVLKCSTKLLRMGVRLFGREHSALHTNIRKHQITLPS